MLLPWLSPKGFEIDRFRETFYFLMAMMTVMSAYIQVVFVLGGVKGIQLDSSRWLLGGLSLFFALMGNRLGKVQAQFLDGHSDAVDIGQRGGVDSNASSGGMAVDGVRCGAGSRRLRRSVGVAVDRRHDLDGSHSGCLFVVVVQASGKTGQIH